MNGPRKAPTGHVIGATYSSSYWGGTYRVIGPHGATGVEVECVTPGGGMHQTPGERWTHLTALDRRDEMVNEPELASTTFWIADEPIKYEVTKHQGSDMLNPGVVIIRGTSSFEFEQGVLEMLYEGDTIRLVQWDGDLDAAVQIEKDQALLRGYPHPLNIWREIWKVALAAD